MIRAAYLTDVKAGQKNRSYTPDYPGLLECVLMHIVQSYKGVASIYLQFKLNFTTLDLFVFEAYKFSIFYSKNPLLASSRG